MDWYGDAYDLEESDEDVWCQICGSLTVEIENYCSECLKAVSEEIPDYGEEYPEGGFEKIKTNKVNAGSRNRSRKQDSYKRARRDSERVKSTFRATSPSSVDSRGRGSSRGSRET